MRALVVRRFVGALAITGVLGAAGGAPGAAARQADVGAELRIVRAAGTGSEVALLVAVPSLLTGRALSEGAFTVTSDAGPVTATVRRVDPASVDLVLVVTAPSSDLAAPTGTTPADVQRAALVELLDALPDETLVAVVTDDPPRPVAPLGRSRELAAQAFATPATDPGRSDEALRVAVETVRGAPLTADGGRHPAVLAIGRGLPSSTDTPEWWPSGVLLSTVRIEPGTSSTTTTANRTGGTTATVALSDATAAIDAVRRDLEGQYRLTVTGIPSEATALAVQVDAGGVSAVAGHPLDRAGVPDRAAPDAPTASPAAGDVVDGGGGSERSAATDLALVALATALALAAAGALVAWRRRRHPAADTAAPATDRDPAPPESATPRPRIVVLAASATSTRRSAVRDAACEIVQTPPDALHALIRHGAATLVIESGTMAADTARLVDAVARHDEARGGTTRVVEIDDHGVVIDLTASRHVAAPR